MKTRLIFLIVFIFSVVFLVAVLLNNQKPGTVTQGPVFKKTSFSNLVPGRSTENDVLKIAGIPAQTKQLGGKKYFYYDTKFKDFKDEVILENGVESFATENVFDSSQGSHDSFRQAFGDGDVYFDGSPFEWRVFPTNGVGIQTDGKEILKILYFVPNNKNSLDEIIKEFGFYKERPSGEVLRP